MELGSSLPTGNELLCILLQSRPPNPLLQGLDCFPDTQMPRMCTTVEFLKQLIPTSLPIWDNQLKETIAKYIIPQFQTMYVARTKVGAIALGQSDKSLQLTGMLLSFVDTTKKLGGHHEKIQACHQTSGRIYTSPSHMHGNRNIRRLLTTQFGAAQSTECWQLLQKLLSMLRQPQRWN